jgi:Uma2 family endonuclease
MSALPKIELTAEEYLAQERQARFKSERVDGEIYAMAGASERHNTIASNVHGELYNHLKKSPCRVYSSDMRIHASAQGNYLYPDVAVVCGTPRFDDRYRDNLLNPVLIVEVLSESTESYDRGRKSAVYRQIESLREYVLIEQERCHVEHYRRQFDNTWILTEYNRLGDSVELPCLQCSLALRDVYDKVELDEQD